MNMIINSKTNIAPYLNFISRIEPSTFLKGTKNKLRITFVAVVIGICLMGWYVSLLNAFMKNQKVHTEVAQNIVHHKPVATNLVDKKQIAKPYIVQMSLVQSSIFQTALMQWVKQNKKSSVRLSDGLTKQMVALIFQKCVERKIDPFLYLALIKVESGFDIMAQSSAGAKGLAQIMPGSHPEKLVGVNVYDPEINLDRGIQILAEYKGWHKGNINDALLQYNGSLNHLHPTYARKVFAERDKLITFVQSNMEKRLKSKQQNKDVKVQILIAQS